MFNTSSMQQAAYDAYASLKAGKSFRILQLSLLLMILQTKHFSQIIMGKEK